MVSWNYFILSNKEQHIFYERRGGGLSEFGKYNIKIA